MKKQNINVGDRLLCKEEIDKIFIKDKYYYVDDIKNFSTDYSEYFYDLRSEFNTILPFFSESYLHQYFYTKQEERKIKLEKLYE